LRQAGTEPWPWSGRSGVIRLQIPETRNFLSRVNYSPPVSEIGLRRRYDFAAVVQPKKVGSSFGSTRNARHDFVKKWEIRNVNPIHFGVAV
jgi:hypothetical protein